MKLALIRWAAPYAVAIAVGAGGAWWVQNLRWQADVNAVQAQWDRERLQLQATATKALAEQQRVRQAQADIIRELDDRLYQEVRDAETEIDRLADAVRRGERRLFVDTTCPGSDGVPGGSAPARVGDGARRAELDRDTAERLIRLTERGDRAIRQLTACQSYIRAIQTRE